MLHLELVSTTRDVPTEVRVIFPEGERELLQRFEPLRSRELALDLPGAWLTNGTYRVGYRATGGHWVEGTVERGGGVRRTKVTILRGSTILLRCQGTGRWRQR